MSLASFWGRVLSCRSNMTRDMIKNMKIWFFTNVKFALFKTFFSVEFFSLAIISPVIYNLQEHAKPQINAKDILS